ncbi:MAG TPA: hypothetical protein H9671_10020 [Firmicutes bacterium]|nr:hypothetical protein [Bacillota bacterium]
MRWKKNRRICISAVAVGLSILILLICPMRLLLAIIAIALIAFGLYTLMC